MKTMTKYHLTLLSKNKTSLDNSFSLIFNYINSNNNILKKYSPQKTKKYFLSILKSPHVNKKAQEQFEFMVYSKQITINYYKTPELLFILKKLKDNLFSDVKLKIRLSLTKNDNNRSKIFYLNNFKLNI
jgi:small subunit ribosomal protein S10